ncbi:hypothetical protein ABL78_4222 [Leptomonas seymouri]|uniref:AATF leucine zipper-containing domain-containing protein n=1 Tax=Leptomonas seymouri TaxID=5684 RepID=A0A0N0P5P4_LEPSE|nr:hypothetical protein ABL78_4222 [Leptomonas seymouri]|eukprot:KPI86706.1 hypothetical protein ABL78_4222 [Leptomonas seymouri]
MPRFNSSSGRQTVVALKHKKKSLADVVNEQLTASALGGGNGSDDGMEYAEGGIAEDFDMDDYSNDAFGEEDAKSAKAAGRTAAASGKNGRRIKTGAAAASRLRHRGPLDASLSEGKYSATPISVEAAVDNIFGALDMGDMDAEGEEYLSDEDAGSFGEGDDSDREVESSDYAETGAGKAKKEPATRKRRRAKDLTEDEYTAWLERKSQKEMKSGRLRRPLSFGGGGSGVNGVDDAVVNSEEADILRQLNELRQTQHISLVPSADAGAAGESGSSTAAAAAQSDAKSTRDTVQQFIMVYGQLLRLRVLLQPAVTRAISVPQYYARPLFLERDAAVEKEAMATAASAEEGLNVVEQLKEQREAAMEKYEELQEDIEGVLAILYATATQRSAKYGDDVEREGDGEAHDSSDARMAGQRAKAEVPSYRAVEKYHERVLRHADACLDHWGSKLVQANSAKLKTISQPLPQQIAAVLTARSRLRARVQKNRSHVAILAHPEHVRASTSADVKAQRALHVAEGDVDAEIYDDADFVRELVRRGGAVANQLEQKVKDMQLTLLPSREGARKGFHRITKGKAVNYEPRPKLVGFMMAESLEDTQRNDVVVKNLFQ